MYGISEERACMVVLQNKLVRYPWFRMIIGIICLGVNHKTSSSSSLQWIWQTTDNHNTVTYTPLHCTMTKVLNPWYLSFLLSLPIFPVSVENHKIKVDFYERSFLAFCRQSSWPRHQTAPWQPAWRSLTVIPCSSSIVWETIQELQNSIVKLCNYVSLSKRPRMSQPNHKSYQRQ